MIPMNFRAFALLLGFVAALPAQDRSWGRSMTITRGGIVATSQTLASQAGAQILARGGSAVDAAIASNAVLGLVEPMMNGIGGDLFMLYVDGKTGKLSALNASGFTPKALTIELLRSKGYTSEMPRGIHTASVPGAVNGWEKVHQKFGRLPWKDLFAPAIYYAENGFPVTELIQWDWQHSTSKLAADDNAKKVFLPGGDAPKVGQIFRNPQLAKAYRLIAENGANAFYRGPIRDAILRTSERLGGTLSKADFEEYDSEWVEPLATEYRGWKVFELPPNGQGIGALEMLNIMSNFKLNDFIPSDPESWHLKIEAQKLAVQDLRHYTGDPKFSQVPVEGLLSRAYARERAGEISMDRANCDTAPGDPAKISKAGLGHTIYMSIADRDGNMVSWIESISDLWGSGVVVDDYGFHLHDRASGMSLQPGLPDSLAPRKRPFHTIIPGYMERDGQRLVFGIMRGINQHQAQAQFVSYIADHGMNIQAALDAPRFTRRTTGGCDVVIEARVPKEVRDKLESMGHRLQVVGEYGGLAGGGQAILRDTRTGVNFGASDPRKDGFAAPEPDPFFSTANSNSKKK
jgi:gamma-glutamyltranspeptidase/glutathione hydrolase